MDQFDSAVDRAFERLRASAAADKLFYSLSALADHSLIWVIIASAIGVSDRRRKRAIQIVLLLLLESLVVNLLVKSVFNRSRPIDRDYKHPYRLRYPLTSSFPSGHTTAAFAAAELIPENGLSRILMFGLASLVGASRIYVKIHHASDVLGGAAIGSIYGKLARRLLTR